MALRDKIPQEETITVAGESVRLVPPTYDQYIDLQHWISDNQPPPDKRKDKKEQERFGVLFTAKCVQLICPDEALSDDEAWRAVLVAGGSLSELARKALALCGTPMNKETAEELPLSSPESARA